MAEILLQHLLVRSAENYPEMTAVADGGKKITYDKLNRISNQVAHQLMEYGCKTGATVAVYLPKSIETLVAFFGVLKAGCAYVPLDAHYSPPKRIKTILRLNNAGFLVTDTKYLEKLSPLKNKNNLKIILTDMLLNEENRHPPGNIRNSEDQFILHQNITDETPDSMCQIQENSLAYILYTSGSTGVPKGVMITHRNALTFINWAVEYFKPVTGMAFANHAPFHFDLSVFDLFVSVASGGIVHLVPQRVMNNPRALVEWIDERKIEVWYSVPSMWTAILNYTSINATSFKALRMILFAGEVFPPKDLKTLMRLFPDKRFFNLYGPTETNVCTCHEVRSADEIGDAAVPIGKACANTGVRAFDEEMREVPLREVGELHVNGPGVFTGYYGDKERTDKVFKKVRTENGDQRWYATGDLVRRMTPDTYCFVGRKDSMVKCAGFRIELPEIEKVLLQHDDIRDAAVVPVYREQRNTFMLKAFLTLRPSAELAVHDIKSWCGELLPRYMIPETVTILDELPKNSNGKTDRQRLTALNPETSHV
jgi:amino acid adenylation domain-containing protein